MRAGGEGGREGGRRGVLVLCLGCFSTPFLLMIGHNSVLST